MKSLRSVAGAMLDGIRSEWYAAGRLAHRSFAMRYQKSRLGVLWELLDPMVLAAIFILLQHQRGIRVSDTGIPYPLFVVTGLLMWQSFTDGLTTATRSISNQKNILSAIEVNPELIVLSTSYLVGFSSAIRLAIALAVSLLFVWPSLLGVAAFAGLFTLLTLLGLGAGFVLAPFSTVVGDIRHALGIITRLGMFVSSVIFPLPKDSVFFQWLRTFNPVAVLIENARNLMIFGAPADGALLLGGVVALAIGLGLAGWYVVHVTLPIVGDQT
jgi:lipopolysaccharide transport system permease protein